MNFKVGDTVQLKSGGPLMTIESDQGDGEYWCIWFASGEPKGASFKGAMLVKA